MKPRIFRRTSSVVTAVIGPRRSRGRRFIVAAALLSVASVSSATIAAGASARPLTPGPGRLSFKFLPAHSRQARAGKRLWSDGFVRRTVTQLNARLTLPENVRILVGPGQSGDALTSGPHPAIKVSYDTGAELLQLLPRVGVYTWKDGLVKPKGASGRRLIDQAIRPIQQAILLHELGHVYTLTWPIPTTSDDEQIADLFASWAAVRVLHDPGEVLALANYRAFVADYQRTSAPVTAAWNRAQGYADLYRLYHSNPRKYQGLGRLIPSGALRAIQDASFGDFVGGPWTGIENALQPIALVPLR